MSYKNNDDDIEDCGDDDKYNPCGFDTYEDAEDDDEWNFDDSESEDM